MVAQHQIADRQSIEGRVAPVNRFETGEPTTIRVSFAFALLCTESATIVALMRTELVTTLKRQATELLADIERDKQPILITQHGLPSAYLVDVETFELLQQRMAVLEGIARGEMAVAEGRVLTHAEAKTRMARWLK